MPTVQEQPGGYRGWCDVCMTREANLTDCREKGRMSWGYCMPECDYKAKKEGGTAEEEEEEGGRLREVATSSFTSAPHPEGNMSCPGHPEKEFCTGHAFFSPMTQTYRLRKTAAGDDYMGGGTDEYEYRLSAVAKRFEPRRVKAKTCFGEAGGSVWRMQGKRIYLTGLISRYSGYLVRNVLFDQG